MKLEGKSIEEEKTESPGYKTLKVQGKDRKVLVLSKKSPSQLSEEEKRKKIEREALQKYEAAMIKAGREEGEELEENFPIVELNELMADMKLEGEMEEN